MKMASLLILTREKAAAARGDVSVEGAVKADLHKQRLREDRLGRGGRKVHGALAALGVWSRPRGSRW